MDTAGGQARRVVRRGVARKADRDQRGAHTSAKSAKVAKHEHSGLREPTFCEWCAFEGILDYKAVENVLCPRTESDGSVMCTLDAVRAATDAQLDAIEAAGIPRFAMCPLRSLRTRPVRAAGMVQAPTHADALGARLFTAVRGAPPAAACALLATAPAAALLWEEQLCFGVGLATVRSKTSLAAVAARRGDAQIVAALCDAARAAGCLAGLHAGLARACSCGSVPMVRAFLDAGVPLKGTTPRRVALVSALSEAWTLMHYAVRGGSVDVVRELLARGLRTLGGSGGRPGDVRSAGFWACWGRSANTEMLWVLLRAGLSIDDVNTKHLGATPLGELVRSGAWDAAHAHALWAAGADVRAPLRRAVSREAAAAPSAAAVWLVAHGARVDVCAPDRSGDTALHGAAMEGALCGAASRAWAVREVMRGLEG